jgi:hypothetical protein
MPAAAVLMASLAVGGALSSAVPTAAAESPLVVHEAFTPDRLDAPTNLSLTAQLSPTFEGVPERATKLTVFAPAGLGIDARGAATCSQSAVRQRGPAACPARSRAGFGGGVGVLQLPSQTIRESFTLDFFFASTRPGRLSLLVYASALEPVAVELVLVAREIPAPAPYGFGFSVEIPPIVTIPGSAPASIETVFASLGAANVYYYERVRGRRRLVALPGLLTPRRCPRGGWVGAATVQFAGGDSLTVHPRIPCPARSPRARARGRADERRGGAGAHPGDRGPRTGGDLRAGGDPATATALAMSATMAPSATATSLTTTAGTGAAARTAATTTAPTGTNTSRIAAALHPDRPGARGTLDLTVDYAQPDSSLPVPVRSAVLRLPEALGIDVPVLRSCSAAQLRARGAAGCPPQSLIGRGEALVGAALGSQLLDERISLWLFVGPLVNLQPTFEILAQGNTPFRERVVVAGRVTPDEPPFGEDLAIPLPPIPTLPLEPDAAIVSLSLTVGSPDAARSRRANAVVTPRRCPAGGLPLAIDSTFADGTAASASYSLPCPR